MELKKLSNIIAPIVGAVAGLLYWHIMYPLGKSMSRYVLDLKTDFSLVLAIAVWLIMLILGFIIALVVFLAIMKIIEIARSQNATDAGK